MLEGFKSRCRTPAEWMYFNAHNIWYKKYWMWSSVRFWRLYITLWRSVSIKSLIYLDLIRSAYLKHWEQPRSQLSKMIARKKALTMYTSSNSANDGGGSISRILIIFSWPKWRSRRISLKILFASTFEDSMSTFRVLTFSVERKTYEPHPRRLWGPFSPPLFEMDLRHSFRGHRSEKWGRSRQRIRVLFAYTGFTWLTCAEITTP